MLNQYICGTSFDLIAIAVFESRERLSNSLTVGGALLQNAPD